MGDGGFSNIYEVYEEGGTLLALKVWLYPLKIEPTKEKRKEIGKKKEEFRIVQVVNLLTTEGHTDKSLKNEIEILQMLQGCRYVADLMMLLSLCTAHCAINTNIIIIILMPHNIVSSRVAKMVDWEHRQTEDEDMLYLLLQRFY